MNKEIRKIGLEMKPIFEKHQVKKASVFGSLFVEKTIRIVT
jgi:predicted nucleotidyltransferase